MPEFYAYMWLRENGTPYYVGKGSGHRAFHHPKQHPIRPPKDRDRIVVFPMRDEHEAFCYEVALISLYGRKGLGTGCLRNMSDGGDGPSGRVPWNKGLKLPEEYRQKLSAVHQGVKLSAEHRKRQGESRIGHPYYPGRWK